MTEGPRRSTRGLNATGVATTIALPGSAATCDEIKLNDVDQCQAYNGGGMEANANAQCTGDRTPFGCCTGSGSGTCVAGDAARCVETAAGSVRSDAADLAACAGLDEGLLLLSLARSGLYRASL